MELAYFRTMYFSQFGEDGFLDLYFVGRPTGFYVDVGAFHPFNASNTHLFYKRGWRGINIEPNPASFQAFLKYRPRDINLNVAVDRHDQEVLFNCNEELSGIEGDSYLFRDRPGLTQCRVRARPLASILHEHMPKDTAIDFMSVDCEGHDTEVLHSNDWSKFRPRVILVEEHDRGAGTIDGILASFGYQFERKLGLTKVFIESAAAVDRRSPGAGLKT